MQRRADKVPALVGLPDRDVLERNFARQDRACHDDLFADLLGRLDRIAALPLKLESRH